MRPPHPCRPVRTAAGRGYSACHGSRATGAALALVIQCRQGDARRTAAFHRAGAGPGVQRAGGQRLHVL
ncbi:hypothetical protein G6F40_017291 [Rhizopus arrhizus]|nr:hypothetical protein G6F40_017291 [Rhizopus arrhizus]